MNPHSGAGAPAGASDQTPADTGDQPSGNPAVAPVLLQRTSGSGALDLHSHFLTPSYRSACINAGQHQPDGMPGLPHWSAQAALSAMNRIGIGAAVLSILYVPGFSLLDAAAAGNIDAIALDRPNYGRSDVLPPQQTTFARNAEILDAAIASLWRRVGAGHSGVVLIGHSIGGAIAVHIGTMRSHDWPLLGLSVTAFAEESPQHVVDAWHGMPADQPLVFSQEQQRMFMFGPDGSFDADAVERSADVFQSIPLAELTEIVGGWRSDFPRLAAHVRVPVQYRLAEFDQLWIVSQERVDALRSKFTHARPVDAKLMAGTGHNIDFHHAGRAWHQEQLAFARQCSDLADPVRTT